MNLTIRPATLMDFQNVVTVTFKTKNKYPETNEGISLTIEECITNFMSYFDGTGFINIFEDDGVFVGCFKHSIKGHNLVEGHIYITEDYIGKGIASTLMKMNIEECKGIVIYTMVSEENPIALKAILDAGWTVAGTIPNSWKTKDGYCSRVILYVDWK